MSDLYWYIFCFQNGWISFLFTKDNKNKFNSRKQNDKSGSKDRYKGG